MLQAKIFLYLFFAPFIWSSFIFKLFWPGHLELLFCSHFWVGCRKLSPWLVFWIFSIFRIHQARVIGWRVGVPFYCLQVSQFWHFLQSDGLRCTFWAFIGPQADTYMWVSQNPWTKFFKFKIRNKIARLNLTLSFLEATKFLPPVCGQCLMCLQGGLGNISHMCVDSA